ncbi:AraC family transcriptional regulator [Roseovarius sp. 2305UL8-3]|uniref:AraC family transcriptional regulator n=1 Tax=Roseovarius conchicola TaxID=3121636 RepID=UPI003527594C
MTLEILARKVDRYINPHWKNGASLATGLPHLSVQRNTVPTNPEAHLGTPSICLILQGEKATTAAGLTVKSGAGQSQILSHALFSTNHITVADQKTPYLALNLTLDLTVMRGLYDQIGDTVFDQTEGTALAVATTDDALIDALGRYFALSSKPWETDVMAPLLLREIHFRLLMAPHGGMLRQLLIRDSQASRVARVIARIRQGFRNPLNMAEMAKVAGMSDSAFYANFKTITGTTPLQYQKDLRLFEARRLIASGNSAVAAAARAVGYDSATQFSREYARKFGASPRSFIGGMRVSV